YLARDRLRSPASRAVTAPGSISVELRKYRARIRIAVRRRRRGKGPFRAQRSALCDHQAVPRGGDPDRPSAMRRRIDDAPDDLGRLSAGTELHQPSVLLAPSAIAYGCLVGGLLPAYRPGAGRWQIPPGLLR